MTLSVLVAVLVQQYGTPPEIETATSLQALTGSGVREGYIANTKQGLAAADTPRQFCAYRRFVARNNKVLRHWVSSNA